MPGIAVLLLFGCAGWLKSYGFYVPDTSATRLFESNNPSNLYHYYYSGPSSGPTAVLGVKQGYNLKEHLWQSIDPDSADYGKLLEGMRNRTISLGLTLRGYILYSPANDVVGIWYSVFDATPVVRMLGTKAIEIIGPPSDLYGRYEDKAMQIH